MAQDTFISVKETLPERGVWVLGTDGIDIIVARWTGSRWEAKITGPIAGITHWFPKSKITFISVKETLPERGVWVLGTDGIDIIVARWTGSRWEAKITGPIDGITHWFPKPKMPNG